MNQPLLEAPDHIQNQWAPKETWYRPGKKIQEFHNSAAQVRFLVGGRGSGKTTADAVEAALDHCWHYAGAKVLVARKTETSQENTAVQTFNDVYVQAGPLYQDKRLTLFRSFKGGMHVRVPSREAVIAYQEFMKSGPSKIEQIVWLNNEGKRLCGEILFKGLNDPTMSDSNLRSFECSMAIMVEADQLTKEDFSKLLLCLRLKDAHGNEFEDYPAIVDTNPPDPDHWIAKLEEETEAGHHPNYQFWHIPMRDNEHNLPKGYCENAEATYRNNPAMYRRMIEGEYEYAYDGNPVYWAFKVDHHARKNLSWMKGAYLVRAWDFGANNGLLWSAYWEKDGIEYWWDLLELWEMGSDTERQTRKCLEYTEKFFPFSHDRNICSGVLDYCDPAGSNKTSKGSDVSILQSYGIEPGYTFENRSLSGTIAIGNRLLEMKDKKGQYVYKVDQERCPVLYSGLCGKYRYPEQGEPGYGKDIPLKGPAVGEVDHIMDPWRYGKINLMRLAKEDLNKQDDSVGVIGQGRKFKNRKRTRR